VYVFNAKSCFPVLLSFLVKDNILIDQTGHARLADFGFLTIISDVATHLPSSSYTIGGTLRWMSPELIAPEEFGMERSRPTKSSDCYSLGMVVYETVSGKKPYQETQDTAVLLKIVKGERPRRCEGFVDSLWGMMEECWTFQPHGRPSVEGVLQCLEMCSDLSSPPPGMDKRVGENPGSNGLHHSWRAEVVRLIKTTFQKKI
jgi:serine/threonine protein kinase